MNMASHHQPHPQHVIAELSECESSFKTNVKDDLVHQYYEFLHKENEKLTCNIEEMQLAIGDWQEEEQAMLERIALLEMGDDYGDVENEQEIMRIFEQDRTVDAVDGSMHIFEEKSKVNI